MMTNISSSSAVGSEIFSVTALLVISLVVLLILRHYLPLRTTPGYLLTPIFFALGLPASIVLLVPIDIASNAGDSENRGIQLPERVILVSWRITYWLTFGLTWFILPILAEYADAGYREPVGRLIFALRENAQYQAIVFGSGILAGIYIFITVGVGVESLKGIVMGLAYCWGLALAIYLMGHGLVAIPRRLFRKANISGRLKRIQANGAKVHEKMEEAIQTLDDLEAQVIILSQRKTGSARNFLDWIEELADESHLPESRPRTLSRRMSTPEINVPNVITERYLADLTRKLTRARHSRARWVDEWDQLLYEAVETQAILDSAASKSIEIGIASPHSSMFDRIRILTPYTRYLYLYWFIPYLRILFGVFLSLASICIIWSEIIKPINIEFALIGATVVHPESDRGVIGFSGQVIASCWILYMCAAALNSLTEVKVWRGRALVRRNTHGESAMWYAMQVAKLSVPLSYNFLTFLDPEITQSTVFYKFLGELITLSAFGEWFDLLVPMFILIPVCATLFNLYGKVKSCVGFGGVIDDEDDENESGYGTGSWREGRDLIERELQGHSSLGRLRGGDNISRSSNVPNNPNNRTAPTLSVPSAEYGRSSGQSSTPINSSRQENGRRQPKEPEDENFFEAFGHRVRNTFDTVQTPRWIQEGFKRPKWMSGNDEGRSDRSESNITNWFGGRQEGRVRL